MSISKLQINYLPITMAYRMKNVRGRRGQRELYFFYTAPLVMEKNSGLKKQKERNKLKQNVDLLVLIYFISIAIIFRKKQNNNKQERYGSWKMND